ncbi:hypothetical protein [Nostoc sp. DSM 114167]|uniref:hypothetical protein n=1 Tax=Nostoc sp. DSM 114167 TaxID=3439050 RepID=UPI004045394E
MDILTGDLVVYAVTHKIISSVRYFVNAPYKIGRSHSIRAAIAIIIEWASEN